jgi:uncharacterized damage-inducible protein DinB
MFNRPEWPPMERTSSRAEALASRLQEVASELVAVIERIDERAWWHTPGPSVWSISKDADHVADAAAYHQWIVRLTIGEKVSSRRPSMERSQMTSERLPAELAALIRERTDDGVRLVRGLTDEQLDLPTRPPRARKQRLAETIELVLIDHYYGHRRDIQSKLHAIGTGEAPR